MYRGIYLPSLGGKLQDERLEFAYLRYAHRQRQKTLMLVNLADIYVKILLIFYYYLNEDLDLNKDLDTDQYYESLLGVIVGAIVLNVILGIIPLWRCYANNYLHWGALSTWLLLLLQGCFFYGLSAHYYSNISQCYGEAMVWYYMFIIFVMYCMLPVPVKWCTIACLLTAFTHVLMVGIVVRTNNKDENPAVFNVFSIGLIHIGEF